jgi:hypothetical protein
MKPPTQIEISDTTYDERASVTEPRYLRGPDPTICKPRQCSGCGKPIHCGDTMIIPHTNEYVHNHRNRAWHPKRPDGTRCGPVGRLATYHCSQACYWRKLRARRREERARDIICRSCGGIFRSMRRDAHYCSGACRQDAYRMRKEGNSYR